MKKLKVQRTYLLLLSLFFAAGTSAQNIRQDHAAINTEKIYLHFDKPFYIAGETAWFKAYLYKSRLPSTSDNELYLQLEDMTGKIIDQKVYPVAGGVAAGDFQLNDTLLQGNYFLKALTKSNSCGNGEMLYKKNLFIYNLSGNLSDSTSQKKIYLNFFPESGHLIDRIRTQVAFEATDENGMPAEVNGVIRSDTATVILPFKSMHDGIGKISFTPHEGEKYFADIKINGRKISFPLPAVTASGVYLKITEADSGKIFELTRSKKDKALFDTIRLLAMMDGDTVFENRVGYGYGETLKGFLSTRNLFSGMLKFQVLNDDGVPLAERLSFVNNREYISEPVLAITKKDLSKRGRNSLELQFPDTVQNSISIAVVDRSMQDFSDRESIFSRLLLTSELRGYVFNPAYYFENDDASSKLALDNLMLTHGWVKYSSDKYAPPLPVPDTGVSPDYLISLSGIVQQEKNNQRASKGSLSLIIIGSDSSVQGFTTSVAVNGRFRFDSLLFYGNAKIYATYTNESGRKFSPEIILDKDRRTDFFRRLTDEKDTGLFSRPDVVSSEKISPLTKHVPQFSALYTGNFKTLGEIVLNSQANRPQDKINKKYTTSLYTNSGKLLLDNVNQPYNNKSLSVIDYLLMSVQTIDVDNNQNALVNKKNFDLQNTSGKSGMQFWPMALLMDEHPATLGAMKTITMDKVALIKIYEAGFVGVGSSAPGGAIAVYLKNIDDLQVKKGNPASEYYSYKGYSITREFYHPDYSLALDKIAGIDNRSTLYWNPGVRISKNSKNFAFNFYNNDFSKKLSVIVEGFDARGKLIHIEKALE